MPLTKIRLSESSQDTLIACERNFQIDRLLERELSTREGPPLSRGHSFGKGVQVYMLTGDMNKALFHAWLSYWPVVEDPPKVTWHRTLHALLCAKRDMDALREKYEVVSFNGLPAVELGFKLVIDPTYYFVGFIDLVLKNRETGQYVILEIKYTHSWHDVEAMFYNRGQGIGYSITLDKIVGEKLGDYGVLYFVCQDKNKEPKEILFHTKEWRKDLEARLQWFLTLGLDVERIKRMRELNHFPRRGQSCIRFNRQCEHFGTCNLTIGDTEKQDEPDPHEDDYQFTYDLKEIVAEHMERIKNNVQ